MRSFQWKDWKVNDHMGEFNQTTETHNQDQAKQEQPKLRSRFITIFFFFRKTEIHKHKKLKKKGNKYKSKRPRSKIRSINARLKRPTTKQNYPCGILISLVGLKVKDFLEDHWMDGVGITREKECSFSCPFGIGKWFSTHFTKALHFFGWFYLDKEFFPSHFLNKFYWPFLKFLIIIITFFIIFKIGSTPFCEIIIKFFS